MASLFVNVLNEVESLSNSYCKFLAGEREQQTPYGVSGVQDTDWAHCNQY